MKTIKPYITEIKSILQTARSNAYQAINFAMVEAYWHIGKRIVEEEQAGAKRANYGEGLIKELSKALTQEFGKGFSVASIENFRKFYLTFPNNKKSYALRRELSWTHYRLIMRVENEEARNYYIIEASKYQWSTRELERNIKTNLYKRLSTTKNAQPHSDQTNNASVQHDFIKDPFVFEFLQLPQPHYLNESDLEKELIAHLQSFLLEMGKGFAFVGRQFRIGTESTHFYIDLVFYNYLLKCFVLIDLKTGNLSHQDIGQIDMYVRMFDDLKKGETDNPTVGIVLCTDRDETIVKYSVLEGNEQLYASKYLTYLPTEEELVELIEQDKKLMEPRIKYGNQDT